MEICKIGTNIVCICVLSAYFLISPPSIFHPHNRGDAATGICIVVLRAPRKKECKEGVHRKKGLGWSINIAIGEHAEKSHHIMPLSGIMAVSYTPLSHFDFLSYFADLHQCYNTPNCTGAVFYASM